MSQMKVHVYSIFFMSRLHNEGAGGRGYTFEAVRNDDSCARLVEWENLSISTKEQTDSKLATHRVWELINGLHIAEVFQAYNRAHVTYMLYKRLGTTQLYLVVHKN